MEILKVDQKIFKQIKPNNTVISYFTSPCKMGRLAEFDDNTNVIIETKGSDWAFLNVVQEELKRLGRELIIINKFVDIEQRRITEFKVNY